MTDEELDGQTCPMVERTVGWALHALEPDEEVAAIEHLGSCAECRRTASEVAEVTTGMAAATEPRDPPPGLRASILGQAARTPQQRPGSPRTGSDPVDEVPERRAATRPGVAPPSRRPRRFALRGRRLLAVAAAIVVLAGGGVLVGYTQQVRSDRDRAMTEALARYDRPGATHAYLAPTPDAQPVAAVMVDGDRRMVINMGLRPNPVEQQTYVLWGVTANGAAPRAVGTFDVSAASGDPISVPSPPEGSFAMYAVSLEQGRRAPESPSAMLAIGHVET